MKLGLGLCEAVLEVLELGCTDATCADADGGGIARQVGFLLAQVPLRGVEEFGEATCALKGRAHHDGLAASRYLLAIELDEGDEADQVARQAAGQFAGLDGRAVGMGFGQVAVDEVEAGLIRGQVAQSQAFAGELAGFFGVAEQGLAVGVAEAVGELVLQLGGQLRDLAAQAEHAQRGGFRQQGAKGLRNDFFADDVTHGTGATAGAAVDVGLEACLVGVELAGDRRLVEVLHPALGRVHRGALLGGLQQGVGVQGHGGFEVQAGGVGVLLVARIERHPGVQRPVGVDVLTRTGVLAASTRGPVDVGLDPDVFHADGLQFAVGAHAGGGDAALVEQDDGGLGGLDCADPVHGLGDRDFDGAQLVARRDVGRAQQRDLQAGDVEGVAALFVERVLRALDGAPGGDPFHIVAHPVVDVDRVLLSACAQITVDKMAPIAQSSG